MHSRDHITEDITLLNEYQWTYAPAIKGVLTWRNPDA